MIGEQPTPLEARPQGFETTPESAERMAEEAKETPQNVVVEAFEAVADEVIAQRPELESLIEKIKEEAFSGRGDIYEEMMRAVEGKKELGMNDEQIRDFAQNIVRKRLLRMTPPKTAKAA